MGGGCTIILLLGDEDADDMEDDATTGVGSMAMESLCGLGETRLLVLERSLCTLPPDELDDDRMARNFLCGLYASSINELVSYNGGACRTRFRTGISSTTNFLAPTVSGGSPCASPVIMECPSSTVDLGLEQLLLPLLQLLLLQFTRVEINLWSCFSLPDSIPESVGLSSLRYRWAAPGTTVCAVPFDVGKCRTTGVIVKPFCVRCAVDATELTDKSSSTDDPELARLRSTAVDVIGHGPSGVDEVHEDDIGLFPASVAARRGADEAVWLI